VALAEGELIVNSSRGGGSKDTWVLALSGPAVPAPQAQPRRVPTAAPQVTGPAMHDLTGQQEQQQQQQGPAC